MVTTIGGWINADVREIVVRAQQLRALGELIERDGVSDGVSPEDARAAQELFAANMEDLRVSQMGGLMRVVQVILNHRAILTNFVNARGTVTDGITLNVRLLDVLMALRVVEILNQASREESEHPARALKLVGPFEACCLGSQAVIYSSDRSIAVLTASWTDDGEEWTWRIPGEQPVPALISGIPTKYLL